MRVHTKKTKELKAAATSGSSKSLLKLICSYFFNVYAHSTALYSLWLLAGISPGLQSSFSSISTSLSIGPSGIIVAVVTLTDLTCSFESGCTSTTRAMRQSFLGARSSTISTRSSLSKFPRGGSTSPSVVDFGRTLFSVSTERHSKDTARVFFYGGRNLLSESFPVEA